MDRAGLDMPRGFFVHSLEEALRHQADLGYPTIIRPSFTMGGSGGGYCITQKNLSDCIARTRI